MAVARHARGLVQDRLSERPQSKARQLRLGAAGIQNGEASWVASDLCVSVALLRELSRLASFELAQIVNRSSAASQATLNVPDGRVLHIVDTAGHRRSSSPRPRTKRADEVARVDCFAESQAANLRVAWAAA